MIWILVALAVTLFLLDIWVSTEILSHLALLILAGVAASHITGGWEWRIAVFLTCYLVTIVVYYLFWKQIMLHVVNRAVALFGTGVFTSLQAWMITAGAVLFYVSDVILAYARYVNPFRTNRISLAFYYAGQFLIALAASYFV